MSRLQMGLSFYLAVIFLFLTYMSVQTEQESLLLRQTTAKTIDSSEIRT